MNESFVCEIKSINEKIIGCNKSIKNLNTMKLDGIVKYLIMPTSFLELKKILKTIRKYNIKYHVIGNGSNVIFSSKDKECLIKLNFAKNKDQIILQASELLPVLAHEFYNKGYKGLEYLSMIPASVGGALYMNASSYNHSISDIVEWIYYLDEDLRFKVIRKEDCCFSYRNSIFKNSKNIILGCKVILIKDEKDRIKEVMEKCRIKRIQTQPMEYPNCGSIFKNGEGYKAWELIDKVNLRGYKNKGAMISDKHCNFIVNYNNASYEDILSLLKIIESEVNKKFKVDLQREIIIIE